MEATSKLLVPPPELVSCISAAVHRNTLGAQLNDQDRLNYFPAAPLTTLTVVLSGQLHMSLGICDVDGLRKIDPLPRFSVTEPQSKPVVSWSPGPVEALAIGFYPDAWKLMGGDKMPNQLLERVSGALNRFEGPSQTADAWQCFCADLVPLWQDAKSRHKFAHWTGSGRVSDWSRHVLTKVAVSGPGRSVRAMERRLKRWTGQSRQALAFYTQIENLHRITVNTPNAQLAAIAADAQFSDQSHMGRAVRRVTGFSPARLNKLIESEEAFWCYRLLGERF